MLLISRADDLAVDADQAFAARVQSGDDALSGSLGRQRDFALEPPIFPLGPPGRADGHRLKVALQRHFGGQVLAGRKAAHVQNTQRAIKVAWQFFAPVFNATIPFDGQSHEFSCELGDAAGEIKTGARVGKTRSSN